MNVKICCICRKPFSVDKARKLTDDYYGPGRYDWVTNRCRDLCRDCAMNELFLADENGNEVPPEKIIYPGLND